MYQNTINGAYEYKIELSDYDSRLRKEYRTYTILIDVELDLEGIENAENLKRKFFLPKINNACGVDDPSYTKFSEIEILCGEISKSKLTCRKTCGLIKPFSTIMV